MSDDDTVESAPIRQRRTTMMPASKTGLRLVEIAGDELGASHQINDELIIGRMPEVGVAVESPGISRRHARITRHADGTCAIEDLDSRNGTLVNGVPVCGQRVLAVGDRIQLGANVVFLFTRDDPVDRHLAHLRRMEVVGRMTASVVHDFNNLLAVMLASLEHLASLKLEEAVPDSDAEASIADALSAAVDAAALTKRLLTVARPAGATRERVRVGAVIDDVVRLCERMFGETISIEYEPKGRLDVLFGATELSQVLMNLCINARDAMPEGGRLTIDATRFDPEVHRPPIPLLGDFVVITVADEGVGMSEEVRERIFDPFFTTKAEGRGSGLGLAIVHAAVRRLGGHLAVESAPGQGTTFSVYIPKADRRPAAVTTTLGHARPRTAADGTLRPLRVLIAADDELNRRSLRRLIRRTAHEPVHAVAVADATNALGAALEADIVILDPDGSSSTVKEQVVAIAAAGHAAPLVVFAAYLSPEDEAAVREAGAVRVLRKPASAQQLGHDLLSTAAFV